jgi:tetratricopeptide (TPR) repeat protein
VRRTTDHARIHVELVSVLDGSQLWSDLYELTIDDLFSVQEEMARQIAATIEPELCRIEQGLSLLKDPQRFEALDFYQRGMGEMWCFTQAGFDRAEAHFRRSIECSSVFARSYGGLGYVNVQRALYDTPERRPARLEAALHFGRQAVRFDDRDCFCHYALGRALSISGEYAAAEDRLREAIDLNPSFAKAYFARGFNLLWAGRRDEAEALLERATLLSPRDEHLWSFHHVQAWALFAAEEYDGAVVHARRAINQSNATYRAYATLTAILGRMGSSERRIAAAELLDRRASYTASNVQQELFFCKDVSFLEKFTDGLISSGVPRH